MANRNRLISVRLTEGEWEALKEVADREGLSLSSFFRKAALRDAYQLFMEDVDVLKVQAEVTGNAGSWVEAYYARRDEWESRLNRE